VNKERIAKGTNLNTLLQFVILQLSSLSTVAKRSLIRHCIHAFRQGFPASFAPFELLWPKLTSTKKGVSC
jgi:hypothetical protein